MVRESELKEVSHVLSRDMESINPLSTLLRVDNTSLEPEIQTQRILINTLTLRSIGKFNFTRKQKYTKLLTTSRELALAL